MFNHRLPCRVLWTLVFAIILTPLYSQPPCPSDWTPSNLCGDIQAQGGPGPGSPIIFCEGETVTVINNSTPANEITNTYIDWGDGLCQSFLGLGDSLQHAYDYPNDTCIGNTGQITFIVRLGIEKICGAESSFHYITFPISVRFPPASGFYITPTLPCVGAEVSFVDTTCANSVNPSYSWSVDGSPTDTTISSSAIFTQSGGHTIVLEVSNECGISRDTIHTNVLDPAIANADLVSGALSDSIVCVDENGTLVILNGLNSIFETSYNWSVSPTIGTSIIGPSDSSALVLLLSEDTLYTIVLTVDNPCMEPSHDTIILQAVNGAALLFDPYPDTCSAVAYTPIPYFPDATYFLNGILVDTFPIQLDSAEYIVTAVLNNQCGDQTAADTFFVYDAAAIAILAPADLDTFCVGGSPIPLMANLGAVTWEIDGIAADTLFYPDQTGQYSILASYGAGACQTVDSITLIVQGIQPETQDIAICSGQNSVPLEGNPIGGVWESAICPDCIQNDTFYLSGYTGTYPIELLYTVNDGICPASANLQISLSEPLAAFVVDTPLCAEVLIQVNSSGALADDFIWLIEGVDVGQPPFQGMAAGTYQITQIAILGDCQDTSSLDIIIAAPPADPAFTPIALEGCSPLSVQFSPVGIERPDVQYNWTFTDGIPTSVNSWTPPDSVVFTNSTDQVLLFPVVFFANNACGTSSFSAEVQVNPNPIADLGIDSTGIGCSPFDVIITNRSSGAPDSCQLSISNGTNFNACFDFVRDTFYADTATAYYFLHLQAWNECGESVYVDTITVLSPDVDAFFEIDDATPCTNTEVYFFDSSVPVPLSVHWDFGDGGFSNDPDPTHVFDEPNKTYEVILRVSTGCGFDTIKHLVTTLDEPEVDFVVPPFGCEGLLVEFENHSPSDLFAYYWAYSDGGTDSMLYHAAHAFEHVGTSYDVSLTVVDWNGCTNSLTKDIPILPKPVVGFYANSPEGCPPLSVHFVDTSQNVNRWEWIFDDGTTSNEQFPGKLYDLGTYSVKLIASLDGICVDSVTIPDVVQVDVCEVYIPNVFAPSSTGGNAIFTVFGSPALERIDVLRIYDNWGGLVYEGIDLPPDQITGWDGMYRGKPMNPGVFVYYTELQFAGGVVQKYSGDVTLIR